MTTTDPSAPQQRAAAIHEQRMNMGIPVTNVPAHAPAKRGPLLTTRDVLACIRDVLLIIVLAAMLIFGGAVVKGISDVQNDLNSPGPLSTCLGEEPC